MATGLKWWRVLLVSLLLAAVMMGLAAWLIQLRMSQLNMLMFEACQSPMSEQLAFDCQFRVVMDHMAEPHWLARLLTAYLLAATLMGVLASWRLAAPLLHAIVTGAVAACLILWVFEPPWMLLLSTLLGSILAGLLVHSRQAKGVAAE